VRQSNQRCRVRARTRARARPEPNHNPRSSPGRRRSAVRATHPSAARGAEPETVAAAPACSAESVVVCRRAYRARHRRSWRRRIGARGLRRAASASGDRRSRPHLTVDRCAKRRPAPLGSVIGLRCVLAHLLACVGCLYVVLTPERGFVRRRTPFATRRIEHREDFGAGRGTTLEQGVNPGAQLRRTNLVAIEQQIAD
jgi:hypothetical protein